MEANKIQDEIHSLSDFIRTASMVWTGKLNLKKIISSAYGYVSSKEYNMNTEIKNRVLMVLEDYEKELKERLGSI